VSSFRLLLIDDHPVVISGLRLLIAGSARFTIVGEARTVQDALLLAEELQPDIVVTDLAMGGNDRIALVEDLIAIAPTALILVYSSSDETQWARHALRAGARGYVSKAEPLEAVAEALETMVSGAIHVSAAVQRLLVADFAGSRRDAPDIAALSARELQILTLMGDGRSPLSLGQELGLSVKTIGSYRERLKIKLGLESMRMLDRYAADYVARLAGRS
jgi:DNA-binding NarL/FixJ family response regulator